MSRDQGVRPVTVPVVPAGTTTLILGSACRLYGWSLADAGSGIAPSSATASFIAAGSATATLPVGASITGFDVTTGTVAAATTTTITVVGAAGGTLTYTWLGSQSSSQIPPYSIRFPQPIAPANPAVAITVTFTGNANTPGGNIAAYGQAFQSAAQIVDGAQVAGNSTPIAGSTDTQWLSDNGVYIGTGVSIKCITGSVSGCIYIMDGTEIPPG